MGKCKVGIIGSGNIGTDLMYKVERSSHLEMSVMIGIDSASTGLKLASALGYHTIDNGIEGLLEQPDLVDIVFDATTAKAHARHSELLIALGKKVIDLTPAAIGPFVVPSANLTRAFRCDKRQYGHLRWSSDYSDCPCHCSSLSGGICGNRSDGFK